MIAFEIYVNGEKCVTAGVGDIGVLNAIVAWGSESTALKGKTKLRVGGSKNNSSSVEWWIKNSLEVGDIVEIKVVESNTVDKPNYQKEYPRPDPNSKRNFKTVK